MCVCMCVCGGGGVGGWGCCGCMRVRVCVSACVRVCVCVRTRTPTAQDPQETREFTTKRKFAAAPPFIAAQSVDNIWLNAILIDLKKQ